MLAAACGITGFLWYMLGGSSEYRGEPVEEHVPAEEEVTEKKIEGEAGVMEVPEERRAELVT